MLKHRDTKKLHITFLIIFLSILVLSAINPNNLKVWFLELSPALIILIFLILTYNKFRLTTLSYFLLTIAGIIIAIGGHYTYDSVPPFGWLTEKFHLKRNYYDRVGHFYLGIVVSILTREFLIKKTVVKKGKLLFVFVISIVLAVSALYELFEWLVAKISRSSASEFLGAQGDIWDTQWDMFLALLGGLLGLLLLKKLHDRYIKMNL